MPLNSRMWAGHREVLEKDGYTVVAPDLPLEPQSNFSDWAKQVLPLVEGPFIPVGISMGGYLTFELWRQASERIPAIALVDTRATPEAPEALPAREQLIAQAREQGVVAVWDQMSDKLLAPGTSPAIVEATRAIALEQSSPKIVAALEAIRDRADSRPTLETIGVPTLVVVGSEDPITDVVAAQEMVEKISRAELAVIEGVGHLPPLERPEEFQRILFEFIEGIESR